MNSDLLEKLAILRDYYTQEEDLWRTKAYAGAVVSLSKIPVKITSVSQVRNIKGIGKGIRDKIEEYLSTGKIAKVEELEPLLKRTSSETKTITLFSNIWGVGEETAKKLYQSGMRSISDLYKNQNLLNNNQKIGLKYYGDLLQKIPRRNITVFQVIIRYFLNKTFGKGNYKMEVAGSYRRGQESSGDVDIIITSTKFSLFNLVNMLKYRGLISDTLSIRNVKFMGIGTLRKCGFLPNYFRLDIEFIPPESWITGLLHWTGSKEFNVHLRTKAAKLGYKLSEYSLYNQNTGKTVKLKDEHDIFKILGEKYIPPSKR